MSNGDSCGLRDDPSGADMVSSILQIENETLGVRADVLDSIRAASTAAQGTRDASGS